MLNGYSIENVHGALQYVPADGPREWDKRARCAVWTDALWLRFRQ